MARPGTPLHGASSSAEVDEADPRADLYSLGCTFYFALAGRLPSRRHPDGEASLIKMDTAAPIESLRPEVPKGAQDILLAS